VAALSKTVTNSLNVFGPAPSNKWNAYNWNAFIWGQGTATLNKAVFKVLAETLTTTDEFTRSPTITFSNSVAAASAMDLENLRDSAGYLHVFPGGVTDATERASPSWADGTGASTSWTSSSTTATSWSAS
jgi:hypothetical protein